MNLKAGLSWVIVKDLEKAKKFYTDVLGFTIAEDSKEYGWVELSDESGKVQLALAQAQPNDIPGSNAIVTFRVANISQALQDFKKKGLKLVGEVMEVPNHVKLQTFKDEDGNTFQLVEMIDGS